MAAVAARRAGTARCVIADATQAVGWLPAVHAEYADALVCGAYKWLMSPRGTALLATTPELAERMVPLLAGWYAGEDPDDSYYGLPLRLAKDARRFDLSPGWFDWVGTATSLAVIESIGVAAVHAHDVALANRFRVGLGTAARALGDRQAGRPAGRAGAARAGRHPGGDPGRIRAGRVPPLHDRGGCGQGAERAHRTLRPAHPPFARPASWLERCVHRRGDPGQRHVLHRLAVHQQRRRGQDPVPGRLVGDAARRIPRTSSTSRTGRTRPAAHR